MHFKLQYDACLKWQSMRGIWKGYPAIANGAREPWKRLFIPVLQRPRH